MVDVTEPMYLIRKGGYYYRPNSQGYTVSKDEAGRYTLKEAINITHPNGPDGPRDGMSYELSAAKEGYDSSECATHGESDNLMGMCCMNTKTAQAAELEALREGVVSQNSMRYLNLLLEAKRMGYESISEAFSAIDQLRARVAALEEGLRDFCLSAECAAGVDEGASEDVAESEIMSFAGSALAVSYSKARALLNHNGEAG